MRRLTSVAQSSTPSSAPSPHRVLQSASANGQKGVLELRGRSKMLWGAPGYLVEMSRPYIHT